MATIKPDSQGTTAVPDPPENAKIIAKSSPAFHKMEHGHRQRRFFLGPMPESVAVAPDAVYQNTGMIQRLRFGFRQRIVSGRRHSLGSEDAISRERAFNFFIQKGGQAEQFEREESSIRAEIFRKLQESRWFREESDANTAPITASKTWIGDTFEVGVDILGLPTLADPESNVSSKGNLASSSSHTNLLPSITHRGHSQESVHSLVSTKPRTELSSSSPSSPSSHVDATSSQSRLIVPESQPHPDSKQPTTTRPKFLELDNSSSAGAPSNPVSIHSALASTKPRGKARVTFSDTAAEPIRQFSITGNNVVEEPEPVEPEEVLERDPSPTTSAGAAARIHDELEAPEGSKVLIRDRMLVRVLSTRGAVQKYLDEQQLLGMPEARRDRNTMWREYLVVWRKSYIELYEPYTITAKEWMTKHKHLAFKIPLQPMKSNVSIFSTVDMSICITCPKFSANSHLPNHLSDRQDNEITLIFIMKPKTRSRAVDWVWRLWRKLGGQIPETIEIRCPILEARVTFPIPAIDAATGLEGYKTFTREKVLEDSREQMSGIPEWDLLVESALSRGVEKDRARLELCWRTEGKLDWVWLEKDVDGAPRPWAVLFGIALMNPRHNSGLELRVAEHFATKVALVNGVALEEPPAVEGYLYRFKTASHVRDPVYLTSHNGSLFFLSTHAAYPPQAPIMTIQQEIDHEDNRNVDRVHAPIFTWNDEICRGAAQMLNAKSFLDMRNVSEIRRATEDWVVVGEPGFIGINFKRGRKVSASRNARPLATTHATTSEGSILAGERAEQETPGIRHTPGVDDESTGPADHTDVVLTEQDVADEGGDEVLGRLVAEERAKLKTRRSFEIVMRNKEIIRFEAYSCKVAVEWVTKLRALISYWTQKQHDDARLEMDIMHSISGRMRFLTSRIGENAYPAMPPNPHEASASLGTWWHCASRGIMKHYYFVLVQGHLIRFKLTSRSHSVLHRHAKTINLLDAYVTSGYFAALELDEGNKIFEPIPRRFQDGLETNDTDIDTLIIIRYRKNPVDQDLRRHGCASFGATNVSKTHAATIATTKATEDTKTSPSDPAMKGRVPALNGKHKMLVLRARSKLERDTWCWAINAEIERLVRLHATREQCIRDDGEV